jgi:hypothetical protein
VILKKSEQKIYSLMRMESPTEILEQYVFSRKLEGDESTALTYQSQSSGFESPGGPPKTKKEALAVLSPHSAPQVNPFHKSDADDVEKGVVEKVELPTVRTTTVLGVSTAVPILAPGEGQVDMEGLEAEQQSFASQLFCKPRCNICASTPKDSHGHVRIIL